MAKVTSKLQVTIPKQLAQRFGIQPGDEIAWSSLADAIRLAPVVKEPQPDVGTRLERFEAATERQRARERESPLQPKGAKRGWTRQELYERAKPR